MRTSASFERTSCKYGPFVTPALAEPATKKAAKAALLGTARDTRDAIFDMTRGTVLLLPRIDRKLGKD